MPIQMLLTRISSREGTEDFVSVVLADTEDVWSAEFNKRGLEYEDPKLVLYRDSVQSACGSASSTVGPFYCPGDHKLYIDLSFYEELKQKFQAPGDFAMAYVIAHEVGHHVQTLLHTGDQSNSRPEASPMSTQSDLNCKLIIWLVCGPIMPKGRIT